MIGSDKIDIDGVHKDGSTRAGDAQGRVGLKASERGQMTIDIAIKRIYEPPAEADGQRVLVDRLWPRGVSKENAALALWLKEIAPSDRVAQMVRARPGANGPSSRSGFAPSWMETARRWRNCAASLARGQGHAALRRA